MCREDSNPHPPCPLDRFQRFLDESDFRPNGPSCRPIAGALGAWLLCGPLTAAPTRYEPGCDPPLASIFSGRNFETAGAAVWQNAVQDVYDKGFRYVSLIPIRYVDLSTGHLLADGHSQAPELSHVAAGVARAKSLGMTVTLNPFVEPEGFDAAPGR